MKHMSQATLEALDVAVHKQQVWHRFYARVLICPNSECLWWTGAITNRGHGRFWLAHGHGIISHRLAWAFTHGVDSLTNTPVLAHSCDNPLCQNVEHLSPSDNATNTRSWATRRHNLSSPLADTRGVRDRAIHIRNGLAAGIPLATLLHHGTPGQLTLPLDFDNL